MFFSSAGGSISPLVHAGPQPPFPPKILGAGASTKGEGAALDLMGIDSV
jgi:hypothetical protein